MRDHEWKTLRETLEVGQRIANALETLVNHFVPSEEDNVSEVLEVKPSKVKRSKKPKKEDTPEKVAE
jgi:hypothetical protein